MRRPRLLAVVILLTLYIPSFAMPAYEFPPRPPGLNHMNITPDGGTLPGFAAFLVTAMAYGWGLVPNVAFVVGLIALAKGRTLMAAIAGGVATLGGLSFLWPSLQLFGGLRWGYYVWLASLIGLVGFAGLSVRIGKAADPIDEFVDGSTSAVFLETDRESLPDSSP